MATGTTYALIGRSYPAEAFELWRVFAIGKRRERAASPAWLWSARPQPGPHGPVSWPRRAG